MVAAFIIIADLKRKTISELFKDTDFLLLNEFYNALLKGMFFGSFVECMWEMGTPVTHDKSSLWIPSSSASDIMLGTQLAPSKYMYIE